MPDIQDQTAFFRDGLVRYAEARETVTYFQNCVYEAISKAFEGKLAWKNFQPSRVDNSLQSGKAMGSVFLHLYIKGNVASRDPLMKAWLSLGLYWNPPLLRAPATVVAASHCWSDGAGVSVPFNHQQSSEVVTLGPLYKKSERRLLLVPNTDFDPDIAFGLLLDAADEALGPLASGQQSGPFPDALPDC